MQGTVDALPDAIDDVHVIAETDIQVREATVHTVPESFECEAVYKGRALEWARRNVPCEREYVLYLDEDTIVANLTGLPDADIVQFTELPIFTGSRLAYLCEVFRIGYQFEQRAFSGFRFPLYVWGGGLAVRHELEDRITWDRRTVTEDTAFVWTAAATGDVSFQVVDARFRNQTPPSLLALARQRRRWMTGNRSDAWRLPLRYRAFVLLRAVIWAFSPLITLLGLLGVGLTSLVSVVPFYGLAAGLLLVFLHGITAVGASIYEFRLLPTLIAVALTIPIVLLSTVGALWGFVLPVRTFEVTEKLSPATVEERHPALSDGDIAAHSGTEPFGDPSAPLGWARSTDTDSGPRAGPERRARHEPGCDRARYAGRNGYCTFEASAVTVSTGIPLSSRGSPLPETVALRGTRERFDVQRAGVTLRLL